jgi:hypothetical protein
MSMKVMLDAVDPIAFLGKLDGVDKPGKPVLPRVVRDDAAELGNEAGSAEMNADKTIVVAPAPATNYGGQISNHSTVQANTVATWRGDEPPVPMKVPVTVA